MIRPLNISKGGKTASFKCDEHKGVAENLNLMTKTKRLKNKEEKEGEDLIVIEGKELTPPCACVSSFPTWDEKNKLGKELGEARPNA